MADLIDNLIEEGWLKTLKIIEAFRKIKRVDFMPEDSKNLAEVNEALSIGYGQTISQPLVVAFMIELLAPETGDKILDIGSGSGWTTALLAEIVEGNGKIVAIDIVPELVEFAKKNVLRYNFLEKGIVEFLCADGSKGYPNISSRPELREGFDKILCSAAVQKELPEPWKKQLRVGGRIVTPIGSSIWLFEKNPSDNGRDKFKSKEYPGFAFVPLIER